MMTNKINLLNAYLPVGAIVSCAVCAFYIGAKMEKVDLLTEQITAYMETYNAERFVNNERDIADCQDDIKEIKDNFDRMVANVIERDYIDVID